MIASLPRSAWLRTATVAYVVAFLLFLFVPLIIVAVFAFNDAPYPAPPSASCCWGCRPPWWRSVCA